MGPAQFGRYGASCCVWSASFVAPQSILVVGGQTETDEGSKHCELYDALRDEWTTLKDLNFDHGIFPAVWSDSDDGCVFVASSIVVVDRADQQKSSIQFRCEMLDHPEHKWRVVEAGAKFRTHNTVKVLAESVAWNANAIRRLKGCSVKVLSG